MSLVRAIDNVPRLFFRPLVGFVLDRRALPVLLFMSAVNAATLNHEAGNDAMKHRAIEVAVLGVLRKFSAEIGACLSNSWTVKVPLEVLNSSMGIA